MSLSNAIGSALYAKLSSGTALAAAVGTTSDGLVKIFRTQAPNNTTFPYMVFSHYAGGPLNINSSPITEELYFVRAYAVTPAQAGTIDALADALLHHGTITVSGFNNYMIQKEMTQEFAEQQPKGAPIFMVGGIYRISLDD